MGESLYFQGAVAMTSEERDELLACSRRIAELLYQEAREQEQPLSTLGEIEVTVREQVQGVHPNFAMSSIT